MVPVLSASDARILFMQTQGLLDDPRRTANPASLARLIDRLGYVQLDSINVVDRGHHLTLGARLHDYRPRHLTHLLEKRRSLFEHWTHDASVIPTRWYPHWKPRFKRFQTSPRARRWAERRMGAGSQKIIAHVKRRLRREGPLMSKHFEAPEGMKRGSWWGWTPQKTALEFLWQSGTVTIAGRENFNKIYDLSERVFPDLVGLRTPGARQQMEWACGEAMERLVVATPGEVADFFKAVKPAEATAWCRAAAKRGTIVAVEVEDAKDRRRRAGYALPDWETRLAGCPAPPGGLRVLSPFDPVVRDRRRLERRFGFDYRFEAFVPPPKREWGYYVLPVLEGDRFIGRLDPKLHRDRDCLEVRSLHWEPGVRPTRARMRAVEEALGVVARRVGATTIDVPKS
jgi:uncharacterized protein YcaQ